jgi:hypothetical protein
MRRWASLVMMRDGRLGGDWWLDCDHVTAEQTQLDRGVERYCRAVLYGWPRYLGTGISDSDPLPQRYCTMYELVLYIGLVRCRGSRPGRSSMSVCDTI